MIATNDPANLRWSRLEISVVKNQVRPLGMIVNGYLKDNEGNGINGKEVFFWESIDNGATWKLATAAAGNPFTTSPTAGTPSQNGYYRFDIDVPQQGTYLFATTFAGDSGYVQANSTVVRITV